MRDQDFGGSRQPIAQGLRWSAAGRVAAQGTRIVSTIALARMLGSEEFGLVGAALVVIQLLESMQDFGTGRAIVIRKGVDPEFASSIFTLNLVLGVLLSMALWSGADALAAAYAQGAALASIFQGLSASLVFTALANAHRGLIARRMDFYSLALVEGTGALVYASVAVTLAFLGYGVWSMVVGYLCSTVSAGVVAWIRVAWLPKLRFRVQHFREIASFSLNLTVANLVGFVFTNIDSFLITRYLGASAMGYYALARRILSPSRFVVNSLVSVLSPSLAHQQDDKASMRGEVGRAAGGVAFVVFPILLGIALVIRPFTVVLLGEAWAPIVPIVQIVVVMPLLLGLLSVSSSILFALGRGDLILRWALVRSMALAVAFWLGIRWGLEGLALAGTLATILVFVPAAAHPLRLISMPLGDLFRAVRPYLLLNAILLLAAVPTAALTHAAGLSELAQFLFTTSAGAAAYAIATLWIRPPLLSGLGRIVGWKTANPS